MLRVSQLVGFDARANDWAKLFYLGSAVNVASASSISTDLSLARLPWNVRSIIVGVFGNTATSRSVSSVSVGGNAASQIAAAGSSNRPCELWGLTGRPNGGGLLNVAATFSGAVSRSQGLHVWGSFTPNITPYATATDIAASSGVLSAAINIPDNGILIGAAAIYQSGADTTWSGLTLDANIDDGLPTQRARYSAASASRLSAAAGATITASGDGSTNSTSSLVLASFKP